MLTAILGNSPFETRRGRKNSCWERGRCPFYSGLWSQHPVTLPSTTLQNLLEAFKGFVHFSQWGLACSKEQLLCLWTFFLLAIHLKWTERTDLVFSPWVIAGHPTLSFEPSKISTHLPTHPSTHPPFHTLSQPNMQSNNQCFPNTRRHPIVLNTIVYEQIVFLSSLMWYSGRFDQMVVQCYLCGLDGLKWLAFSLSDVPFAKLPMNPFWRGQKERLDGKA